MLKNGSPLFTVNSESSSQNSEILSEILHTARQVFDVIAERSPTSSTTRTSNNSLSSSTSKSSGPVSERSEALSNDYSTKLSRAKNRDIALAIALYHRFGAGSLLQEKLTSSLISTMMTAIRLVFCIFCQFYPYRSFV